MALRQSPSAVEAQREQYIRNRVEEILNGVPPQELEGEDLKAVEMAVEEALAGKTLVELCASLPLSEDARENLNFMGGHRPSHPGRLLSGYFGDEDVKNEFERLLSTEEIQRRIQVAMNYAHSDPSRPLDSLMIKMQEATPEQLMHILNDRVNACLADGDMSNTGDAIFFMQTAFNVQPSIHSDKLFLALSSQMRYDDISNVEYVLGLARRGGVVITDDAESRTTFVNEWLESLKNSGRLWSEVDQEIVDLLQVDLTHFLPEAQRGAAALAIVRRALEKGRVFSKEDYEAALKRLGAEQESIGKDDVEDLFRSRVERMTNDRVMNPEVFLDQLKALRDIFGFSVEDMDPQDGEKINKTIQRCFNKNATEITFTLETARWANSVGVELNATETMVTKFTEARANWYAVKRLHEGDSEKLAAVDQVLAKINELEMLLKANEAVQAKEIAIVKFAILKLLGGALTRLEELKDVVIKIKTILDERGVSLGRLELENLPFSKLNDVTEMLARKADEFYESAQQEGQTWWTREGVQAELDKKFTVLEQIKQLLGVSEVDLADRTKEENVEIHRAAMRTHAESMADAARHIGPTSDVNINGGGRYLTYTLEDSSRKPDHANGIAEIVKLASSMGEFAFQSPVLIANGVSLNDPRGPISVDEFAEMLRVRGIRTNDRPKLSEEETKIIQLIDDFSQEKSEDAFALKMKLLKVVEILDLLDAVEARGAYAYFRLEPQSVQDMLTSLAAENLDSNEWKALAYNTLPVRRSIEYALEKIGGLDKLKERFTPHLRQYV